MQKTAEKSSGVREFLTLRQFVERYPFPTMRRFRSLINDPDSGLPYRQIGRQIVVDPAEISEYIDAQKPSGPYQYKRKVVANAD